MQITPLLPKTASFRLNSSQETRSIIDFGGATPEGSMRNKLWQFIQDQSGATAIEYGLIAAGISIAIVAAVQTLGTDLKNTLSSVSTALK